MAENSNQEEAAVTQLGGGEGYGSNHFIYMETLFGRWGGEGGIHAQRGYILNLGVSISVSS